MEKRDFKALFLKMSNPYKLLLHRCFKGAIPLKIWKKGQKTHVNKILNKESIKQGENRFF